ncbi:hypothetical protein LUZ60_008408 [Juncus effusus]|nr:hypothetical protein LUZ60_008408 [Juncus effusus]
MNFRFQNLLGAPYRGGNVVIANDSLLLSPAGNRIISTDLVNSRSVTFPFEAASDLARLAVSSDGKLLLAVDSTEKGRAVLISVPSRAVLHRLCFNKSVNAVKFSPDGGFIAVGLGKLIQIWRCPGFRKEFFPFNLEKTIADFASKVTSFDWSPDSKFLLASSKDLTVRLISLEKSKRSDSKPFMFLGHKETVIGAFFSTDKKTGLVNRVYSVSRDGAIFTWELHEEPTDLDSDSDSEEERETEKILSDPPSPGTPQKDESNPNNLIITFKNPNKKRKSLEKPTTPLNKARWKLTKKNFFMQTAKLSSCDYHNNLDLIIVGFSNGVFGLYQMPDFICIHLLSISREKITTAVFNKSGNWLTFGCARLGQLLVWEWRSESYVLKQQGHYFDVNCVAYSPDSQLLATGADDNKVKVWTVSSGFCFITFSEHTNAVTALHFMANNHSLLSASLDGTVRAWDLFRYRNFRTFTTPQPRQFVSLAADLSGDVICAGTLDSFEIFVWSMKTGRLLDVLSGHEGPVHGLMFSPINNQLASSSWDKTVRIWDVFNSKGATESFPHNHDVLTLTYRPDGRQLACSTLDGLIHFWDPQEGLLTGTIEGRRDIAGGRLMTDRRTAESSGMGKYFTSLCYSADGEWILAGGNGRFVCMYDVAEQVLLKRFQITHNLSLDGVLDFLNSKSMTSAGPLDLIDDLDEELEGGVDVQIRSKLGQNLPGSAANKGRPVARTKCVKIAPAGRSWAVATTEGVLVYSADEGFVFDPTDLDLDVTVEKVDEALGEGQKQRALLLSLRLNEDSLIKKCIFAIKPSEISQICNSVPFKYLQRLIEAFASLLESCPHLEFVLQWCQELCKVHGHNIQQNSRALLPALKSLQKAITKLHQDLADTCSSNEYLLKYLSTTGMKFDS